MPKIRRSLVVLPLLVGLALTGCSASGSGSSDSGKTASHTTAPKPVAAPADLTGEWKQSNAQTADSYQTATITADSIEVDWVADSGATTSLYWAGTYTAPGKAGAFSWDSQNDTAKTENALLASSDPTKTFAYDGDKISYKVTALGTTVTVELSRK
jgi:hypothetical protein